MSHSRSVIAPVIWILASAAAQAQDGTIVGEVRDYNSGAPLAGVRIVLEVPAPFKSTVTSSDGGFRFDHVNAGQYLLRCSLDGYGDPFGSPTHGVRVRPSEEARITINLTALSVIEGTVRDEEGSPMPGVDLYTGASLRATSDQDGKYTISHLSPGKYKIAMRISQEVRRKALRRNAETGEAFGYAATEYYPGTADMEAALEIPVTGTLHLHGIDLRARRMLLMNLAGRIVERAGGEPLAGGQVALISPGIAFLDDATKRRAADSNGGFRFDLLPAGRYSLEVYRSAEDSALPYVVPIVLEKTGIENMVVTVPPFPVVDGVIRTVDGQPWTGKVQIKVANAMGAPLRELTAYGEQFSLGEFPPGKWRVRVQADAKGADGRTLVAGKVQLGEQNARGLEVVISESGSAALTVTLSAEVGRISGSVIDADGSPAAEAGIFWREEGEPQLLLQMPVRSTKDGTFSIDTLAPGAYHLDAADSRRNSYQVRVDVKAGETTFVTMRPVKRP